MIRRLDALFGREQIRMETRCRSARRSSRKAQPALDRLEERIVLSGASAADVATTAFAPAPELAKQHHRPLKPTRASVNAITKEYKLIGKGMLGKATSSVEVAPNGTGDFQLFRDGVIYYTKFGGADDLYGAIFQEWKSLGATSWGYPTMKETATPDGVGLDAHFALTSSTPSVAAIDWTPTYGTHVVQGPIAALFAANGWEQNGGEPISNQINLTATGGEYQYFAKDLVVSELPYAIDYTAATGAYVTNTGSYTDIAQGNAGDCWILASMAALEANGHDLSQRIQYVGNDTYHVVLYVPNDPPNRPAGGYSPITVSVNFDGSTYPSDPGFTASEPSQSWVVVMGRAVIEAVSTWDPTESVQSPHGGGANDALATLTGDVWSTVTPQAANAEQQVVAAIAAGHNVVLGTNATTTTLVADHCYAVLGVSDRGVLLYNPWGAAETSPTPDPDLVSWNIIAQDGNEFFFD
jgi:LGFP repeat/Calpain family cysteine protease